MTWDQLRSTYDTVAPAYEARFLDELDNKPRDRKLLDAFAVATAPGDLVLEVGCGPGQIGRYLRHRGRRVVGVDLSPGMARLAATRLDGAVAGDLRALPMADASVGGVVALYSLIHLPRTELTAGLQELARVVQPGGALLYSAHEGTGEVELDEFVGVPVPWVASLFTLDELVTATEAAGLDIVTAEQHRPYAFEHPTDRLYVAARRGTRDGVS